MRTFVALALSALPLISATLQIDHVTIAGQHLDVMRQAFTAATGIPTEYGGRHNNHATEMALTSFPDASYLEFMGIQAKADPAAVSAHVWSTFLKSNSGPCAFALRVPSVGAEVTRLKYADVPVKAPVRSGRTRPDGVQLAWETSDVGSGVRGTFLPFLIQDVTWRKMRVYPSGKPTTKEIRGIALIVIGVPDLDRAVAEYRHAFNLPEPRRQKDVVFDSDLAWFENSPIVLAKGASDGSWVSRRVARYGSGPCGLVLASRASLTASTNSQWFGRTIMWIDESRLGWRLGLHPVK